MKIWRTLSRKYTRNGPQEKTTLSITCFNGKKKNNKTHFPDSIRFPNSVIYLPVKVTAYSTLIGLLNIKNEKYGKEIIDNAAKLLSNLLQDQELNKVKILVRFLACLVNANVLLDASLIDLFDHFLSAIGDEDLSNKKQSSQSNSSLLTQTISATQRSDFYVFLVLQTLPWVSLRLNKQRKKKYLFEPKKINILIFFFFMIVIIIKVAEELAKRKNEEFMRIWNTIEGLLSSKYKDSLI